MVCSMTGFGRVEYADADRKITVEIKSVNHRYLELGIKMPRSIGRFENDIRKIMKNYMSRGKVDCFITYHSLKETGITVNYDPEVAKQYVNHLREMQEDLGLREDLKPSIIAKFPDVFTVDEDNDVEDFEYDIIEKVVREACEKFAESRAVEGENLAKDLTSKMDEVESMVNEIEKEYPVIVEAYQKKLHQKVEDILGSTDIDESRIIQEVTIYADKIAVDEEMVRLHSHVKAVKKLLNGNEPAGRKLDFMIQEMNREANTTLSKTDNIIVTDIGINLKTCIEKVREQVQNLE